MNIWKCLPLLCAFGLVFNATPVNATTGDFQQNMPGYTADAELASPEVEIIEEQKEAEEVVTPVNVDVEKPVATTPQVKEVVNVTPEVQAEAEIIEEVVEEEGEEEIEIEVPVMGAAQNKAKQAYRDIMIKTLAIVSTAFILIVALSVHEVSNLKKRKAHLKTGEKPEVAAALVKASLKTAHEPEEEPETNTGLSASDLHKHLD